MFIIIIKSVKIYIYIYSIECGKLFVWYDIDTVPNVLFTLQFINFIQSFIFIIVINDNTILLTLDTLLVFLPLG